MRPRLTFLLAVLPFIALAQQGQQGNPFEPPRASLHYAPDRQYDLQHLAVVTTVDYAKRTITGRATNTVSPLRSGLTELRFMAGTGLDIKSITVGGAATTFRREGKNVFVRASGLAKGKSVNVAFTYVSSNAQGRGFGQGGGGWHWIQPRANTVDPLRVGFWTQGETESNSEWAPTWDYPNDFATSETVTTVPADWIVVGNGSLVSKTFSKAYRTAKYHWKMTQPHATYLLSLCGGPFDVKKDNWEGVELWYVVPKGMAMYIDDTFSDTKDMLSFFSQRIGVKYPWPKYAQNSMYDFGGGMENVSATTLGEGSLTEARDGFFRSASLNSHELGHQWFGDLVSCMDWGDIWLNESFATFMESIYFEHSRGPDAYMWEIEGNTQGYLEEARRYVRPLSTKMYPNGDSMFDSHSYPKGGAILHTLRRFLGDEAFFAGLKAYLTKWRHTPVQSSQLCRVMTESSGINCEPFWKQWIDSPGHPVLDYTWKFAPDREPMGPGRILLTVKQLQDTSKGTPIYNIATKIGFTTNGLSRGGFRHAPVHITKVEETFDIPVDSRPACVVLDPDHDFLREIREVHWAKEELPFILMDAPNPSDRTIAMSRLLDDPTETNIKFVTDALNADRDREQPAFQTTAKLAGLNKPELRSFWMGQLENPNFDRQAQAVVALGRLPADAATTQKLRSLINERAPIQVVVNAITALAAWDKPGNADVFKQAQSIKDRRGRIKRAADTALTP